MTAFNERLRSIRKEKGYTQKKIADAVGASERNYQDWEYGNKKPVFDTIIALADFFDVDANYLLGRVQTPDSLVIEELAYDNGTLFVHFRDNAWYQYLNVPEDVYKSFVAAPSKGKFFLENVMTNYSAVRASADLSIPR